MKKLYIIQKWVIASSVSEAIRIEKSIKPDDCYLDSDWRKSHMPNTDDKKSLGFNS